MPYIQRDQHGEIVALTLEPSGSGEFIDAGDMRVQGFLANNPATASNPSLSQTKPAEPEITRSLQQADLDMIRVIEDLIDLLEAKNVLMFSELPIPVQNKLLKKRGHRQRLKGFAGGLLAEADDIL
jgi:hypothetical protein